ncbi:MAG: aminotransferase class I/II-fold pyridoxal phosphate-dependent enzyme [Acidimicrobiales bacterium]
MSADESTRATDSGSMWRAWVDDSCHQVRAAGQWRQPRTFDAQGPIGRMIDCGGHRAGVGATSWAGTTLQDVGQEVVSFASNDYLGLSCHPTVIAAAHEALDRWGAGSGASRLVTGTRPVHSDLESSLAAWKRCEQAMLFPTGFAANVSVLSVFATDSARVFSDELNHASIIDGCRAIRSDVTVFRHRDLGHLDRLLKLSTGRPVIVSDTVFSMDGDLADVAGLVDISRRYGALLVLDEAHAVLGPEVPAEAWSRGTCDLGAEILRVGTLSKTLGSLGGFVAGPTRFIELLVNRARPYIFTTAPAPASVAAALAALAIVQSAEGDALCRRLSTLVSRVVSGIGGRADHLSPIVPVVIGEEEGAVAASTELLAHGLWVPAIRPPTVPAGTSRLRVTLSSIHSDTQVDRLVSALRALDRGAGARNRGQDSAPVAVQDYRKVCALGPRTGTLPSD